MTKGTILAAMLSALNNLQVLTLLYSIAVGFVALIWMSKKALEEERSGHPEILRNWKYAIPVLLLLVPGPEDIWKVRVAMLKLELSSSENVKALTNHAEEVVKALECKHLGVNCGDKK